MALNLAPNGEDPSIAVLIPCYNEELTIRDVVGSFRAQLPHAKIYVFDNNSTDQTAAEARAAGAIIASERRQGKGYVVQSMFGRIDADFYVMVDGDGTYPAAEIHNLLAPVLGVGYSRPRDKCRRHRPSTVLATGCFFRSSGQHSKWKSLTCCRAIASSTGSL